MAESVILPWFQAKSNVIFAVILNALKFKSKVDFLWYRILKQKRHHQRLETQYFDAINYESIPTFPHQLSALDN